MPHAENRADNRERERSESHVQIHHPCDVGEVQGAERVHRLPPQPDQRVGHSGAQELVGSVALASQLVTTCAALFCAALLSGTKVNKLPAPAILSPPRYRSLETRQPRERWPCATHSARRGCSSCSPYWSCAPWCPSEPL